MTKISGGFVYCEKCKEHHCEAFVCGKIPGEFSISKEYLEKHGIAEEDLDLILTPRGEIPEGYMRFEEAIEYLNNLVKTSPEWREVYEKFSVDRGITRELHYTLLRGNDLNRE